MSKNKHRGNLDRVSIQLISLVTFINGSIYIYSFMNGFSEGEEIAMVLVPVFLVHLK